MTDTDTTEGPDTSKLAKIRALLDKAESTADQYPAEAEALTVKAIELMEQYRITEAMIADAAPLQDRGKLIKTEVFVGSGPYVKARIQLMDAVARAHSVKLVIFTNYRGKTVHLNGYETDVALTEMLYTSLLIQATRAMGSDEVKATKPYNVHGTAFNRAFLIGFADRIAERMLAANHTAAANHTGTGRSVALVLADRSSDVDEFVFARYGKLRTARPSAPVSSTAGVRAGRVAASKADLSTDRRVSANGNRALSA